MNPPGQIFLSHTTKDDDVAAALCRYLEARGLHCWLSARDIQPGANYGEAIIEGINASHTFVLIFSRAANTSIPVASEVERAYHRPLHILTFRIEEAPYSERLEFFLSSFQHLDATKGRPEDHFAGVYEYCLALQQPTVPTQPMKGPPVKKRSWVALIAGVATVLAVVLYFSIRPPHRKGAEVQRPITLSQTPRDTSALGQTAPDTTKNPAAQAAASQPGGLPNTLSPKSPSPNTPSPRTASPGTASPGMASPKAPGLPHIGQKDPAVTDRQLLDLEGARFIDGTSEALKGSDNEISFSGAQGNKIGFFAKLESYRIQGKMLLQGHALVVAKGDTTGSLVLKANGGHLSGSMRIVNAVYQIEFTKVP